MADTPTLAIAPSENPTDGRHLRGQRRQRAVIEAARELFIAHGYRGTTLEAIIARAGGSRETIYRVFGGKRGLFGRIIAEVGERVAAAASSPDALELPPREGLTRFALDLAAFWRSDEGRAMNRMIVSEGLDAPEIVDAWYRGGTALSIAALARYFEAQAAAGRMQVDDPRLLARQFVTLLIGELAFPLIAVDAPPVTPAAQVERCVDLILRASSLSPD